MPKLGLEMNVLYSKNVSAYGYAEQPKAPWRNPYMIIGRNSNVLTGEKEHHNQEITCTHEMYHVYQGRYIDANDIMLLKFMEMSAMMMELAFVDFKKYQSFYKDENTVQTETFAIPIDYNENHETKMQREGYCLARFFRYLNELDGSDITGKDLCVKFKKYGQSIISLMLHHFGIENSPEVLDLCWETFIQSRGNQNWQRYVSLYDIAGDNKFDLPSLIRKIPVEGSGTKQHFSIESQDFTCKGVAFKAAEANFGVILVPDEALTESLPTFRLLPLQATEDLDSPKWQITAHGTGISVKGGGELAYAEMNGIRSAASSGYTVYTLPQPAEPAIEFVEDEELGDHYEVTIYDTISPALRDGVTDEFLIILRSGSEELLRQVVEPDNWDRKQIIYPEDIKKPKDKNLPITISVCEHIEATEEAAEFYGPESAPVWLDQEYPVLSLKTKDANGDYGDVSVTLYKEEASFTLDRDGFFSFTFPGDYTSWDNIPVEINEPGYTLNPFMEYSRGHASHTGFTVTGKIKNTTDVNNWVANISSCSANKFEASGYEEYVPIVIEGGGGGPVTTASIENEWNGAVMINGTLELKSDTAGINRTVTVMIHTKMGLVSITATFKSL